MSRLHLMLIQSDLIMRSLLYKNTFANVINLIHVRSI